MYRIIPVATATFRDSADPPSRNTDPVTGPSYQFLLKSAGFISDQDHSFGNPFLPVQIFPIQHRRKRRNSAVSVHVLYQVLIGRLHPRDTAHRGLHHFRIEQIGRIRTAYYPLYPKPIGRANNGAQISRILNIIQNQCYASRLFRNRKNRFLENSQYLSRAG